MRKRRSTVYVRPGKDVTLYIPTETPPEVVDFLNRLKKEGMFSYGVMEIVTKHVRGEGNVPLPVTDREETTEVPAEVWHDIAASLNPLEEPEGDAEPVEEEMVQEPLRAPEPPKSLDLAQIFRQAQYNAGKLTAERDGRPAKGGNMSHYEESEDAT